MAHDVRNTSLIKKGLRLSFWIVVFILILVRNTSLIKKGLRRNKVFMLCCAFVRNTSLIKKGLRHA